MTRQGEDAVRHKALDVCSEHSTLSHTPGMRLFLRLCLQVGPELGIKKCCRLVEIFCNYNLATSTYWHLQFTRPVGLLRPAPLRECPLEGFAEINSKHNKLSINQLKR